MRERKVDDADGREWFVRARTDWSRGPVGDDFEHDVTHPTGTLLVLGSLLGLWTVLVFVLAPDNLIFPWFFWVGAGVIAAIFPQRWWSKRPITVRASTLGTSTLPSEEWRGAVIGSRKLREEVRILVRRLRTQGTPGHADSPMQPVGVPQIILGDPGKSEHRPTVATAKPEPVLVPDRIEAPAYRPMLLSELPDPESIDLDLPTEPKIDLSKIKNPTAED